ncbi:DNA replication/repair protein RecF [candidate division CSSED10-310 bacterium]|uniref:DNA replication and repair protein RecF n=1 Tax=candidate division CSSED10-310 bacterium TaxID=2855610 RepID=A0ABV6YWG4_UNCC1
MYNLYPGFLAVLRDYGRVVQQRNSLLNRLREGAGSLPELDSWNQHLIELGTYIFCKRVELVNTVNKYLPEQYSRLSSIEENIKLCYKITLQGISKDEVSLLNPEEVKELYKKNIAERQNLEITRGHTLFGPHRDDFSILLGDKDLASFGSQGEKRSALIALKLTEIALFELKRNDYPITLLDDIFSELDAQRSKELLLNLDLRKQTFLSTTSLNQLETIVSGATLYEIQKGALTS